MIRIRVLKAIISTLLVVSTLLAYRAADSAEDDFASWLQRFKDEVIAEGISPETADKAFARIGYNELVIKLDRNQPEFKLSLSQYLARTISAVRVQRGKEELRENSILLRKVSRTYGVPPQVLVALWGIETDFGRVTGGFSIIESLATLTYDQRRSAFFRKELLAALHLLDGEKLSLSEMEGSWAGALGYLQFLPSVILKYGVDFDGDGKLEIWNTSGDLFATGSRYLALSGWKTGWKWGREVRIPPGIDKSLIGLSVQKELSDWQEHGVRTITGAHLPSVQVNASLIHPDDSDPRFFLIYDNFRVLMKWNRSTYYALAVGRLADLLKE